MISREERGILRPMPTPEDQAREHIDQALEQAGWKVQDYKSANLQAGRGVVLQKFSSREWSRLCGLSAVFGRKSRWDR